MDTKQSIIDLVSLCYSKGIRKVVFSPGSRNAPMIIAFNEHGGFECFSIPDERVSAFFALGLAQQSEETVAIVSTSGSAALNFAPAVAEAYYQRISLLVITADRPPEWIDQGNGQTMRQRNLYANYIKESYEVSHETIHSDELWYNVRIFNEAINKSRIEPKGPTHINFPLREPLYDFKMDFKSTENIKIIDQYSPPPELSDSLLDQLALKWNQSNKKLILCGISKKSDQLNELLSGFSRDESVIILTETTSNLNNPEFIEQIDRMLFSIEEKDYVTYQPDLLLTFGTNIISKKIKTLFRKWKIKEHWHIDETDVVIDTFKSLTKHLKCDLVHFFDQINKKRTNVVSSYKSEWTKRNELLKTKHDEIIAKSSWSDLKAYYICIKNIPSESYLQMANSAAVRYVQLMENRKDITYHSNRGVAGIDGCTSTAVGAAWVNSKELTVLVTGDIAFFYDSNALWMPYLSSKFRIILFNNEGGNIFRIIPGPDRTSQLEQYFESHHNTKAKYLAKSFGIVHYEANNEEELNAVLKKFFSPQENNRPALLELHTPRKENDKILKRYFEHLT